MKQCNYCGEVKECTFIEDDKSFIDNLGRIIPFRYGMYICDECLKAKSIINKKRIERNKKRIRDRQYFWRKERDKILMEGKDVFLESQRWK